MSPGVGEDRVVGAGSAEVGTGPRRGGDAGTGPWWWARRRSMVFDVLVALTAAVECGAGAVAFVSGRLHWQGAPGVPAAFALGMLAGLVLVVRRRWPVVPAAVAIVFVPGLFGVVLLTVSLYTLAACRDWRAGRTAVTALPAVAFVETLTVALVSFLGSGTPRDEGGPPVARALLVLLALAVAVGVTVPPVVLGLYVGARRRLVESLRDRAEGLETELALWAEKTQERARRARMEERTRIAREMHDVVAHRVSLMVVHAGALERTVSRDPERAARSARLLGEVGRQALDELRQILGVLRMAEGDEAADGAVPAPRPARGADGAGPAAPGGLPDPGPAAPGVARPLRDAVAERNDGFTGPGLADLPELVGQSRAAGIRVELSVTGEPRAFAAEAEHTAYRMVQEALTNVHKHAGGADTRVSLAYLPTGLRVTVANGCAGRRPGGAGPGLPGGGNGLVGMRERVTALGGAFEAGPLEEGGFRVAAVLPARPDRGRTPPDGR